MTLTLTVTAPADLLQIIRQANGQDGTATAHEVARLIQSAIDEKIADVCFEARHTIRGDHGSARGAYDAFASGVA